MKRGNSCPVSTDSPKFDGICWFGRMCFVVWHQEGNRHQSGIVLIAARSGGTGSVEGSDYQTVPNESGS